MGSTLISHHYLSSQKPPQPNLSRWTLSGCGRCSLQVGMFVLSSRTFRIDLNLCPKIKVP